MEALFTVMKQEFPTTTTYSVVNTKTKKQVASCWKDKAMAEYVCQALNLQHNIVRFGFYEQVMARIKKGDDYVKEASFKALQSGLPPTP